MTRYWPFQNLYFEAGTSARKAAIGTKSDLDCPTAKGRLESQISSEKKLEENQQYDSINQSEATIFIKKISPNVLCQDSYSGRNLWVRIRTDPSELFPQSSKSFSIESWIVANVLKLQTLKRSDWEVGPNLTVNSDLFSLYSTRPGDFFPISIGFFTSLGLFASVTFPLLFSVKSFHCHLH